MTSRDLGVLDSYFAGAVTYSGLSNKAISFGIRGENPDVDTATIEDVWQDGGRYSYLATAAILSIVSSSINDSAGQGGLEVIRIKGCDSNFKLISEQVTLNGTTPVLTVNLYYRVFSMVGDASNTADLNVRAAGKITATDGANIQASIFAGSTASKMANITVLDGYTGFLSTVYTSGGPNDDFIMRFAIRSEDGVFISGSDIEISNSSIASINFDPFVGNIQQHSDVKVEAQAVSQNAQVRINYVLTMIENRYLRSLAGSI